MVRTLPSAAAWIAFFALSGAVTAEPATPGSVLTAFPPRPDPTLRYVVYLHGRIVEEQGKHAVSPDFGHYQFEDIMVALARPGVAVIGELRVKGTEPKAAAAHVVDGVRGLIKAGIPAARITVVGASKGALIAMLASTALDDREIGWVVMASCNDSVASDFELALHGKVLSIYETSDDIGGTCGPIFAASPALAAHDEIRLETGMRHGFLYRPLPAWVRPALAWSEKRAIE
jgi:hypothetical protein